MPYRSGSSSICRTSRLRERPDKARQTEMRSSSVHASVHQVSDDDETACLDIEGLGILSRAAFQLHTAAAINSVKDGHPGFVADEWLNAIPAQTTTTVAELEVAGIWARRP